MKTQLEVSRPTHQQLIATHTGAICYSADVFISNVTLVLVNGLRNVMITIMLDWLNTSVSAGH